MSGTYQQNKKSIYNWCAKNMDKKREINRGCCARYHAKKRAWKNVCQVFNSILLD